MRTLLRYLVLFGGVVLMITGCNSLISQQFGTHRLRTIPVLEAQQQGVGDADFIELKGARLGDPFIVGPAMRAGDKDVVLRPILTELELERWHKGAILMVNLVGWMETEDPACVTYPGCPPLASVPVRGLVDEPAARKNPTADWRGHRIYLAEDTTYVKLNEEPLAWYWNLALFLGGLLLAVLPEARRFSRQRKDQPPTN